MRVLWKSVVALSLFPAASLAMAQDVDDPVVIVSDKYGRGATVGAVEDAREGWQAQALSGEDIAQEFFDLCVANYGDKDGFDTRARSSTWSFEPGAADFPEKKKTVAMTVPFFTTAFATATYLEGDTSGFDRRAQVIRDRGALVIGPSKAKNIAVPQCNLDLKIEGMTDATELATKLTTLLAEEPVKLTLKKGYGDGHWEIAPPGTLPLLVYFQAVDLKRDEQLVHLSVQPAKQ